MRTTFVLLIGIALGTAAVFADSWAFAREVKETVHEFGDSRIVLIRDTTRDTGNPDYRVAIYLGDDLVAKYCGVAFETIFASPDNEYFVGLSNAGLTGTAFVIFDRDGKLIREQKHRFMPTGIYTDMSITLIRRWFDEADPDVRFEIERGVLRKVSVNGSTKVRYELLETDLGFSVEAVRMKRQASPPVSSRPS